MLMAKILIVGGPGDYQSAGTILRKGGYDPVSATNMKAGIEQAQMLPFGSLILCNFRLGDKEAPDFITELRKQRINHPVIVYGSILSSVDVCKAMNGHKAIDFVQQPAFDKELLVKVNQHLPKSGTQKSDPINPYPRTGRAFLAMKENVDRISAYDSNVMVMGETGLGKERIARYIHGKSHRANKPLVIISHPDYISETLSKVPCPACHIRSCFEKANGGTVIIKNIHSFCPHGQALIMSEMESGKYDVRVIATSDISIRNRIADGTFNPTLVHFTATCMIEIPCLRDCPEDVESLANFFLTEFAMANNQHVCKLTPGAVNMLIGYNWPRNARELRTAMTQCASVSTTGRITTSNLEHDCYTNFKTQITPVAELDEETRLVHALRSTRTLKEAAELLGMCEKTLHNKRRKYGLDVAGNKKLSA